MKILMLTSFMDMGGAETHIAELCVELVRRGHTVEVVSAGGRYSRILEEEGIPCRIMPLQRKDPLSAARCILRLNRLIRRGGFDVIHAHSRIPAAICGVLCRLWGIPFVTTAHLDFKVTPLLRRIAKWGDAAMAVSDDIARYLVMEYGVPRERIFVTVNGIDTERFVPSEKYRSEVRREYGISDQSPLIVSVSRLDRDRSTPAKLLSSVMPKICRIYPDARLLIAGDGNDMDEVQRLARRANGIIGYDAVILAGARCDIERLTAAADVFCGVSRAVLEAMAAGCPVVLSGNQGHMGIFREGDLADAAGTNFCCRGYPLPSEERLFSDVTELLSLDKDDLRRIREYNRSTVAEHYSVGRMTEDYLEMYEWTVALPRQGHIDAVVSGYYGYGNSGDDTALRCFVSSVREVYPEAQIAVLCRHPQKFGECNGVIGIGRYNIPAVIRAIRKSGLLISGGGSLFQNMTSNRSLKYYAGVIALSKLCGARVFIYANGIGPVRGQRGRRTVYRVAMMARRISVRDEASKRFLSDLGVPEDAVTVTADPAFMLTGKRDLAEIGKIKHSLGLRAGDKYFAVSLRRGLCRGKHFEEICLACREIYLGLGYIPLFVSMQESEDSALCGMAARECCGEAIAVPFLPSDELCALIRGAEAVLSMRLHLIVYAAAMGVPSVGISVDPKLDAMSAAGLSAETVDGAAFAARDCVEAVKRAVFTDRAELVRMAEEQKSRTAEDIRTAVEMMCRADAVPEEKNLGAV